MFYVGLFPAGVCMTLTFRIVADGADITVLINDRLLLLRTTHKPGMESDDFELRIDDRDSAVSLPSRGASIEVFFGYSGASGVTPWTRSNCPAHRIPW